MTLDDRLAALEADLARLPGVLVAFSGGVDSGVLLVWQGNGHTAYPKTECVAAAVDAYLINLTAPLDGLTCPA